MSILEELTKEEQWLRFLEYKKSGGHLSEQDEVQLRAFVASGDYRTIAGSLADGGLFSLPEMVSINKRFSSKKRNVFLFPPAENMVQKLLGFLLMEYDDVFASNLYSFRKNTGVKHAMHRLLSHPAIGQMHSFKIDISDYFNSVDIALFLPMLRSVLKNEAALYTLLEAMLSEPCALVEGKPCTVKKGILAGSPLSGFFANLFLSDLDRYFEERGVLYARYSDDIIVFAPTAWELEAYRAFIEDFLAARHLETNPAKLALSAPGEAWSFLGFSYQAGVIDISPVSKNKLKKKIKRKARALERWRKKKGAPPQAAARALIKYFNRKFYDNPANHELTWCRWYFPIINNDRSLKELDA